MSLTLRGGGAFGFKDLFAKVINDVEVEAIGYNVGVSLKTFLFRTKYFFGDFRADFNFEESKISLAVKKRYVYVPIRLGYDGGTDTGVVFNGNAFLESKWKAYAISPKIVFGLKIKEKIPVIQYFSSYLMLVVLLLLYQILLYAVALLNNFQLPFHLSNQKYFFSYH